MQMVFSITLELTGVFIALWLNHKAFSSVSSMAIIVLTGMDATTDILLIDQIMRHREQGIPRNRAIREACPTRLRPILMTSLITIAVMIHGRLFPVGHCHHWRSAHGHGSSPHRHSHHALPVDDASRWVQLHVLKKDPASLPPIDDE